MKISCKSGEPGWCSFPLSINAKNLSMSGGGIATTKPKDPLDASGGYKNGKSEFYKTVG